MADQSFDPCCPLILDPSNADLPRPSFHMRNRAPSPISRRIRSVPLSYAHSRRVPVARSHAMSQPPLHCRPCLSFNLETTEQVVPVAFDRVPPVWTFPAHLADQTSLPQPPHHMGLSHGERTPLCL
ncbi:hypothetical protein D1007_26361 [Hordeum vulgare]|nr:hypothetical protein D1007_26361 [Hordeum vulgare]